MSLVRVYIGVMVLGLFIPLNASAATPTLTDQQRSDMQRLGLDPNVANAADILNLANGGCAQNPHVVLATKYSDGQGSGKNRCSPDGLKIIPRVGSPSSHQEGIDSALACRLTKLFEAAEQRGCRVKIISAYRSPATQQCMCGSGRAGCAAAGGSCHQPGLAVDVSAPQCLGWLRMAAPQFKLVFPYSGPHIQCAEHPQASTRSCNRPCDGGVPIQPDLTRLPPPSQVPDTYFQPPPGGNPMIRDSAEPQQNPFGSPTPQFPPMQTPATPPIQQTPQSPVQQNPLQQSPLLLSPSTTTDPLLSTTTPFLPSSTTSTSTGSTSVNTGSTNMQTSGSIDFTGSQPTVPDAQEAYNAALDTIMKHAGISVASTSLSVPTSISLNSDLSDAENTELARLSGAQPLTATGSGATVNTLRVGAPSTFTSGDLKDDPLAATRSESVLIRSLTTIRDALVRILDGMRPRYELPRALWTPAASLVATHGH